jgi:predicted nucleic acid-binding protein
MSTSIRDVYLDTSLVCAAVVRGSRYHLNSYDALHVATAMEVGISTIATLDADFVRVTGMNVVVVR